jgi:hypothetical protein
VHTLNVQSRNELTQALTQSLIELDNIGTTMHKPHQKLPSAPTSEVVVREFITKTNQKDYSPPLAQRLRKKMQKPYSGSNPLFEYRR